MEDRQIKSLVDKFAQGPSGYDTAMEELRICYGRAFPTYVKELVQPDTYDYTQESALRVLDRTQHLIAAMEKLKGATLSQVAVALVVMNFDEEMSKEWSKHLGYADTIPKVEELVKFITPLTRNLPSKKTSAPPPTASAKQTHVKKEEHKKPSSALAKNSCPLCKGSYNTLTRCSTFMEYIPGQRWNYIRQSKGCINCLHPSHQVRQCASVHSCHTCKARHHTLLHKEEDLAKSKEDSAKTKSTGTSLMTSVAPNKKSPAPPGKTVLKCGFIQQLW